MSNVQPLFTPREEQRKQPSPKKEALDAVVRAVTADAHTAPMRYLRETRVPAGGE